jgi:hypothetical protein
MGTHVKRHALVTRNAHGYCSDAFNVLRQVEAVYVVQITENSAAIPAYRESHQWKPASALQLRGRN